MLQQYISMSFPSPLSILSFCYLISTAFFCRDFPRCTGVFSVLIDAFTFVFLQSQSQLIQRDDQANVRET